MNYNIADDTFEESFSTTSTVFIQTGLKSYIANIYPYSFYYLLKIVIIMNYNIYMQVKQIRLF